MFEDAYTFNQPIGNWKVSSGTDFVSVTTKTYDSVSNLDSESIQHWCMTFLEGTYSLNQTFFSLILECYVLAGLKL
jgi:hypothetical protein